MEWISRTIFVSLDEKLHYWVRIRDYIPPDKTTYECVRTNMAPLHFLHHVARVQDSRHAYIYILQTMPPTSACARIWLLLTPCIMLHVYKSWILSESSTSYIYICIYTLQTMPPTSAWAQIYLLFASFSPQTLILRCVCVCMRACVSMCTCSWCDMCVRFWVCIHRMQTDGWLYLCLACVSFRVLSIWYIYIGIYIYTYTYIYTYIYIYHCCPYCWDSICGQS